MSGLVNASGWVEDVTDPRGIKRRAEYDHAGRTTKTIEAYCIASCPADANRTTEYTYDAGDHVLTLKAVLPGGGQQTTQYYYVARTAPTGSDDLNSNDLQTGVFHPDKTTGLPSGDPSQSEVFVYNRLGQPKKAHYDRNGTYHDFSYDVVGRPTEDSITILGGGLDNSVQRLAMAYDEAGRPFRFTSWSLPLGSGGVVRNEVERTFSGLGQLTREWQCHTGTVSGCSGGVPSVQYAYSEANNGSNQYVNHSRLKSLTYPDGRLVVYTYGTSGSLNDTISRLGAVTNSATTFEGYDYVGHGTPVRRWHQQGGSENIFSLTYIKQAGEPNGDAGDPYTGLDRFGRVVDQRWLEDTIPGNPHVRFKYGYDRNGNRLYRENLSGSTPNHAFDELYHANGASAGYDNFNQLTAFRRGVLSDTNSDGVPDTVATATYSQTWALDIQGNWDSLTTYNGTTTTTETRTHNKQNQITAIPGQTSPAYDNNGAMTTDQTDKRLKYDAWGRLVEVRAAGGGAVLVAYAYDALGRRIAETVPAQKDFYYSEQWQLLEERHSGIVKVQYLWSPVYVDALILRDRDTGGSPDLDERLYVLQDANWNVVAVANPGGTVLERYVYEPYGKPAFLDGSWGARGSSLYAWVYLHQGGRYEAATGLYHFRNRELSAALGRWNAQDPAGLGVDTNLYRYEKNAPPVYTDASGLLGVFFGGAGAAYNPGGSVLSFLRSRYHPNQGEAWFEGTPGPFDTPRFGAVPLVQPIAASVLRHLQQCPEPLDIIGYSRGGAFAVILGWLLLGRAQVRFLGLIDPIRTFLTDAEPWRVSLNVQVAWQALKEPPGNNPPGQTLFLASQPVAGAQQTWLFPRDFPPPIVPPGGRTAFHHGAMDHPGRPTGQDVRTRLVAASRTANPPVQWLGL